MQDPTHYLTANEQQIVKDLKALYRNKNGVSPLEQKIIDAIAVKANKPGEMTIDDLQEIWKNNVFAAMNEAKSLNDANKVKKDPRQQDVINKKLDDAQAVVDQGSAFNSLTKSYSLNTMLEAALIKNFETSFAPEGISKIENLVFNTVKTEVQKPGTPTQQGLANAINGTLQTYLDKANAPIDSLEAKGDALREKLDKKRDALLFIKDKGFYQQTEWDIAAKQKEIERIAAKIEEKLKIYRPLEDEANTVNSKINFILNHAAIFNEPPNVPAKPKPKNTSQKTH